MTRVALKGLLQRKLRALLTALAVVLGVAMVSGTFMLTDSIQKAFDSIFTSSYAQTDASSSGTPIVEGATSGTPDRLARAARPRSARCRGVEAAAGSIVDLQSSQHRRADRPRRRRRSRRRLTEPRLRRRPRAPALHPAQPDRRRLGGRQREVVIDAATAKDGDFDVGDPIGVSASGPSSSSASPGSRRSAASTRSAARRSPSSTCRRPSACCGKDGYDSISVAAREGTSVDELIAEIRRVLPAGTQVEVGVGPRGLRLAGGDRVRQLPPVRAARLRRDRALRRRAS